MLCIIAGHFGIVSAERFVFTFHVPLFFLLSGYFLSTKVSFLPFMKQKARQLLVPYYVTGVVLLIVATVVNHFVWPEIDALNNAKSMLGALLYGSGAPHSEPFAIRQIGLLWFLWALFFSTGFTRLALKTKYPLLTVCLIAAVGWASSKVTWLPFSIQPGAMASFFMYLGFLARKHGILDKKPPLALIIALILLWIASIYFGVSINIVVCFLSHGLLSIATSIAASYLVILACKVAEQRFRTVSRFLNFFGQTTLIRHVLPRDFRFLLPESHALQLARALRLSPYRRERSHPRAQCAVAAPWRIRFLARSFAEKAIQRPPDIASSRTQVGRLGDKLGQAPARGWPFPLQRRYGGAGDAIGMPWHKSRGIPRKQPRIGTPAKVSRSAQQENTRSRHSALRRPSPIPVTSVGRLGFCARIWSRACRRMCGYDSFGPFAPFDSASRSLRGRVSSADPTR